MRRAAILLLALAAAAPAAERSDAWVSKRVREIRDSDTEAWRKIPWSDSLLAAGAAAKKDGRLMFLFSHDGNIDTGRC
jgi:hypothetical protein